MDVSRVAVLTIELQYWPTKVDPSSAPYLNCKSTDLSLTARDNNNPIPTNTHQVVLFLDYDGTLSPIVDQPDKAFMKEGMRPVLAEVCVCTPVAIVSDVPGRHVPLNSSEPYTIIPREPPSPNSTCTPCMLCVKLKPLSASWLLSPDPLTLLRLVYLRRLVPITHFASLCLSRPLFVCISQVLTTTRMHSSLSLIELFYAPSNNSDNQRHKLFWTSTPYRDVVAVMPLLFFFFCPSFFFNYLVWMHFLWLDACFLLNTASPLLATAIINVPSKQYGACSTLFRLYYDFSVVLFNNALRSRIFVPQPPPSPAAQRQACHTSTP